MSNGIRSLPRYQEGGRKRSKEERYGDPLPAEYFRMEGDRRRAMAREEGYASIGPTPSWAERVAAQVRSVPRRINRALQPETAGETAALVGASMVEPLGTGIDIADIVAGMRTGDIPRMGWGALGLALPIVAGSTLRKVAKAKKSKGMEPWELEQIYLDENLKEFDNFAHEAHVKDMAFNPSGEYVDPRTGEIFPKWEAFAEDLEVDNFLSDMEKYDPVPSRVYSEYSGALKSVTQDQAHADALEAIMKSKNIDPSSLTDQDWEDLQFGRLVDWWPPEGTGQWLGDTGQGNLTKHIADNAPSISKDLQRGITALGRLPRRISRKLEDFSLPMDEASVARRIEEQGYEELLHGTGRRGSSLSGAPLEPDRAFFQVDNPSVATAYGEPRKVYSRKPNQLTFDAEGEAWSEIPIENIRRGLDPNRLGEFDRLAARYIKKPTDYPFPPADLYSGRDVSAGTLSTDALSLIARGMGYTGFDAHRLRDAPWSNPYARHMDDLADVPSFVRSTLDPGLVRYEGAKFNPRDLGKNLPLSGVAALLGVGATGAARRNYVEREQ